MSDLLSRRPMTDTPTGPLVEMVREAVRFADWAAGEGITPAPGEPARAPEDFLMKYSTATGDEDWDTLADRAADLLRRAGIAEPAGLVWEEHDGGDTYFADAPFRAEYEVCRSLDGPGWDANLNSTTEIEIGDLYSTLEAARAACEADYQARALTMWPALAGEVERLRAALRSLRPVVENHRDQLLRDFTTAGSGDRSTMDEGESSWVGVWDEATEIIDAALASSPQETTPVVASESPSGSEKLPDTAYDHG